MLTEMGQVIIATGGFGADFSEDSLLAKYQSDLMHLSTSNGAHCIGNGTTMGEAIGARTIDLEWVQVHPTGLVNPRDPDANVKFLAAESPRGVGGFLFYKDDNCFANEVGFRDYVTVETLQNKESALVNPGPDCDWLMDVSDTDISLAARLDVHSAPRTQRGKQRFPEMTNTHALIQMVEKITEKGDWAQIITTAR